MSSWLDGNGPMRALIFCAAVACAAPVFAQTQTRTQTPSQTPSKATAAVKGGDPARFVNIGREATAREVAAWDIDVRPDFKGLPPGSGSVAKGQDVWEAKCASCHGVFAESNSVFNPIIGGTTADDIKTGHVKRLLDPAYPGRTTIMKVATVSTLWDYINRAMPWTQPKSLTVEEVYSVTAFLLNLADVVPADFTLSDKNIAEVQKRMPNRNGMTTQHALWPGPEFNGKMIKPDTTATLCMSNCAVEPSVKSMLPDFARNAHGNLSEQNRLIGAQHGVDTSKPAATSMSAGGTVVASAVAGPGAAAAKPAAAAAPQAAPTQAPAPKPATAPSAFPIAQKNNCTGCHALNSKILGPSFADIAKKYPGKADYLAGKIISGGSGVWGPIPMPPQTLSPADAKALGAWLASGAGQ